ncbi:OLC1v1010350C1 [Oldenlandia corymbosa var. corymbosa]|uniref:OLC1v1010350C1 n=1 Tax=Oldenlandia corymbosa var. corymbosa TaxID=529605 RepID=A0AAV1DRR1_OLDCO|nr:OLC1v1010350C1 [Oldenlandia corymbosa var. corymbosa]
MYGGGTRGLFRKVILSCNPTTSPDDFFLGAICWFRGPGTHDAAFMRVGQKTRSFARNGAYYGAIRDIIFHNELLYVLKESCRIVAIGFKSNHPIHEIVFGSHNSLPFLVSRNADQPRTYNLQSFGIVEVHKLAKKAIKSSKDKGDSEWIQISELGSNDSLFWADHDDYCTSAICVPNFNPNSIYFTDTLETEHPLFIRGGRRIHHHDIAVFRMHHEIGSKLEGFKGDQNDQVPVIWITPTLC